MATTTQTQTEALTHIVAGAMQYDELPDFDVFHAASGCVQDSVKRAAREDL